MIKNHNKIAGTVFPFSGRRVDGSEEFVVGDCFGVEVECQGLLSPLSVHGEEGPPDAAFAGPRCPHHEHRMPDFQQVRQLQDLHKKEESAMGFRKNFTLRFFSIINIFGTALIPLQFFLTSLMSNTRGFFLEEILEEVVLVAVKSLLTVKTETPISYTSKKNLLESL